MLNIMIMTLSRQASKESLTLVIQLAQLFSLSILLVTCLHVDQVSFKSDSKQATICL